MIRFFNSVTTSAGAAWCQLMHPDPMWPVNGEYQCRVCLRRYPVAWEAAPQTSVQRNHGDSEMRVPAQTETIATAGASQTF